MIDLVVETMAVLCESSGGATITTNHAIPHQRACTDQLLLQTEKRRKGNKNRLSRNSFFRAQGYTFQVLCK